MLPEPQAKDPAISVATRLADSSGRIPECSLVQERLRNLCSVIAPGSSKARHLQNSMDLAVGIYRRSGLVNFGNHATYDLQDRLLGLEGPFLYPSSGPHMEL